jgi:hypothetical protein
LTRRVQDKNGTRALDLVRPDDAEVLALVQKSKAQHTLSRSDIAGG